MLLCLSFTLDLGSSIVLQRNEGCNEAMKVVNNIIVALNKKRSCAALFTDLSKAFDTVDNAMLKQRLLKIDLSD